MSLLKIVIIILMLFSFLIGAALLIGLLWGLASRRGIFHGGKKHEIKS